MSRNGFRPGFDIKANGGYVIGVGSNHLKGEYRWAKGRALGEVAMAPVPEWLLKYDRRSWLKKKRRHASTVTCPAISTTCNVLEAYVAKAANAATKALAQRCGVSIGGKCRRRGIWLRRDGNCVSADHPNWNYRNNPPLTEQEAAAVRGKPLLLTARRWCRRRSARVRLFRAPSIETHRAAHLRTSSTETHERKEITYQRITSAELASGDYSIEFAIELAMVLLRAAARNRRTDESPKNFHPHRWRYQFSEWRIFSWSLQRATQATGAPVMSGESGLGTIQETAHRISSAANLNLADLNNLIWSPDLPKFGSASDYLNARKTATG